MGLTPSQGYGQGKSNGIAKKTDSILIWSSNRKLRWSDFLSSKKLNNTDPTQSMIGITAKPYYTDSGTYEYKILAYFHKFQSIANAKNDYVLNHEQVHFDIAELFARKMRKEIAQLEATKGDLTSEDYTTIYTTLFNEYRAYQHQYDTETNHSTHYVMQQLWDAKVADDLKDLAAFSISIE